MKETLKEIGEENNNASDNECVTKRFLTDIENDYDALTGFKSRRDELKNECIKLNKERNRQITKVGAIPYLGSLLSSLFRKGLTEDDIFQVAILFHEASET